ncbi:hypothetical protein A6C57_08590 [Fibrella sp. ES10-3-2-2]|nr:hypothetical protein A6C57_08590 [Fibrella sp. ES10-3-2-2]
MRITKSPLELVDFFLLDTQYRYVSPEGELPEADTAVFENYDVDLDYMFQPDKQDQHEIWVYVRTAINCGTDPLPGYTIFLEGTGHFRAKEQDGMSDEVWGTLLNNSALAIVINNLRSAIMQITAHGPFGKYILPSMDLADLHHQKAAAYKAATAKKRRAKKKESISDSAELN